MNDPIITSKWIALIVSASILLLKYWWAVYTARKQNLIISIRLFSFYPGRRIEGTSSSGKRHFMSASNWWSVAFWISFVLCGIFWLLDFFKLQI